MSPSPSAAATNITGPSKFLAINVSGVSGPKLPRNTTNALQPCSFTSATALSISCSFSTVVLQLYKSPLYSFTMFSRRWVERAIGKQSRLTAMIPSLTTGMLLLTIIVLFLYINYLDSSSLSLRILIPSFACLQRCLLINGNFLTTKVQFKFEYTNGFKIIYREKSPENECFLTNET